MKNKKEILILSISMFIFLILGFKVRGSNEGVFFDVAILNFIHGHRIPLLTSIMKFITSIGSVYFYFPIVSMILIIFIKDKYYYGIKLLLLSTIGSYTLNYIFKNIFLRVRPLNYFLIEQGGYSYPSGHAMVSITFYSTMTYLALKTIKDQKNRRTIKIVNFVIISLIGFSRIYLGVHWPTDILAGYLLGYLYYKICIDFIIQNK